MELMNDNDVGGLGPGDDLDMNTEIKVEALIVIECCAA